MSLALTAASAASDPTAAAWVTGGISIGVAVAATVTTITVTWLTLRARSKDLDKDRRDALARWEMEQAASLAREERDRAQVARIERAEVYEDIITEIASLAESVNERIRVAKPLMEATGGPVPFEWPSRTGLTRAMAKFTSRLNLPSMFEAVNDCIVWAYEMDALRFPVVLGILQERIDAWYSGARTLEMTLEALKDDAEGYRQKTIRALGDGPMPASMAANLGN